MKTSDIDRVVGKLSQVADLGRVLIKGKGILFSAPM